MPPDWLSEGVSTGMDLSIAVVAVRLVLSAIMGVIVGAIYRYSHRKPIAEVFPFYVTMVLLTILVAMTTLVIGNSVARAFSLVGALSIVRFRTVVDDTRDTAFVIFAVVVGMAVGAGIMGVCYIGVPVVAVVSMALCSRERALLAVKSIERRLELRVDGGVDPVGLLTDVFRQQLATHRLTAASTARQGASLDLEYSVRLSHPDGALQFVKTLAELDGVQSVELK